MPEEELRLNDEQLAVLDLYASLRNLERSDVAGTVCVQAAVDASKPDEDPQS